MPEVRAYLLTFPMVTRVSWKNSEYNGRQNRGQGLRPLTLRGHTHYLWPSRGRRSLQTDCPPLNGYSWEQYLNTISWKTVFLSRLSMVTTILDLVTIEIHAYLLHLLQDRIGHFHHSQECQSMRHHMDTTNRPQEPHPRPTLLTVYGLIQCMYRKEPQRYQLMIQVCLWDLS